VNLYDRTVEGLELLEVPGGTVQYHPEAGPVRTTASTCSTVSWSALPRRDDIHKILILGSGPIVIGQAAEFDYSGVQACKVLREEGYEVVLVNSNPATIMTDPSSRTQRTSSRCCPPVAQVIKRERPDALLGTLGGQTALNLAKALHDNGTLEHFGVELIGANYDAIACAEDRELFRDAMDRAGFACPAARSPRALSRRRASSPPWPPVHRAAAYTLEAAEADRPQREEFERIAAQGLEASPISQVLLTSR